MNRKRTFSLLLALALVLSLLPAASFAAAPEGYHLAANLPTAAGESYTGELYLGAEVDSAFYALSGTSASSGGVRTYPTSSDETSMKAITLLYGGEDTTYGTYYYITYTVGTTSYAVQFSSATAANGFSQNAIQSTGAPTNGWQSKHQMYYDQENSVFFAVLNSTKYIMYIDTENSNKINDMDLSEATDATVMVRLYEKDANNAVELQEGIYYLKATRSGTTYYFRKTVSGESVGSTTPYSVYTDTDKSAATLVDVIEESTGNYSLAYPYSDTFARIYVYDIGTDGEIDTGVNTKNAADYHHFQWDSYNGRFYQMEGDEKYVLAVKELDNTNTGEKQIRMLAVLDSELSDTVVPVKLEVHTTHTVDTWEVTTPPTTTTTGVKTGACTVCEREVTEEIPVLTPTFWGNGISLSDAFSSHFYVEKAIFADGVYQNPYVVFLADGAETTVSDYREDGDYYLFTYDDITPDKMGETVKATLYADKAGVNTAYATKEYSVAQYCYDMLAQEQPSDALRTLLVDTLNFGAAAQQYRGSTAELVNAKLTEEQKAWGSADPLRALTTCKDFGDNNGEVKWYGVSALMGDRVQMRVYFEAEDTTGLTVVAKSGDKTWELTDIATKDGKYYVDFSYLNPTQMSEQVTMQVYRNGAAVSTEMRYSLESYAESWLRRSDASAAQKALVTAMIRYGDAAKAYADRVYDLESDVLYMGRVYETNDTQWFNWSASGFKVQFQGSGIKAQIASNAPNETNYAYLKVYVDGVEREQDILLDEKLQTITLAEDLDPNETHTVEVRKRNSPRSSTAGLVHLELTDGTKLARPAEKERLIEFVGDSLTVGYSAAITDTAGTTAWSTATEDGTKTYSKQVADALNAEYMVTAISGRGVVMNNGGSTKEPVLPYIYPKLDYYNDPDTNYDFSLQPDVIVINLGTNDATNADLDIGVFQTGVVDFINLVRQKNPNAKIIWAYGLRSDNRTADVDAAIQAAVAQVNADGDSNVHYLALDLVPSTQTDLNHPLAEGYVPSGELLIDKIGELTGW